MLPDTEGEVEAETPGARWVVLGIVPADRAEGRKRPSCPENCPSPGWGGDSLLHPPAWPKPAGESHRARAPLPGKEAQGLGGRAQPGSPRLPQWRNGREEEVLDGDPDLGAFPLTSCHRFTAGGGRGGGMGGGEVDLPSIHVFECSSSRVRTSCQFVSEPEIHPPWMDPPALEVLGAQDTSRLPLVSLVKWDDNCLVGIRMR